MLGRVPAAVADAPEQPEQLERVDSPAPGDAVLAVGRERHVLRAERAARADLRRLLAEQGRPEAQLALALQGDGLGVQPADEHQIAVEALQFAGRDVERVVGVLDPLTLRGQELNQFFGRAGGLGQAGCGGGRRGHELLCGGRTACFDGHVPLLESSGPAWDRQVRPVGVRRSAMKLSTV